MCGTATASDSRQNSLNRAAPLDLLSSGSETFSQCKRAHVQKKTFTDPTVGKLATH